MSKIYIVEDEENIREITIYGLKSSGFECTGFGSGEDFFNTFNDEEPELVILDVMLPGMAGIEILEKIRTMSNVPVIFLSAKGTELDRIKGLDSGADDYITKPFSVLELISRVKTVLRRSTPGPTKKVEEKLSFNGLVLECGKRLVTADGEKVELTRKEYNLLEMLLKNQENVVSRDSILGEIWGYSYEGESRTVDMHIKSLRQKIGVYSKNIHTVRGIGYKLGEQ